MEKQPMCVTVERPNAARAGDAVVVRITGEIGLGAMVGPGGKHTGVGGDTSLEAMLREAVPNPPKLVVVDLTGASYLSSLGIGTLIRFRERVASAGGSMRLAANEKMITLLKFGRLDTLFSISPDVGTALNA